jgi:hypothetical protein
VEALEDRTVPSFAGPVAFNLPAAPQAVAVGHLRGASAPADVVMADANGTVSVLLGKGDGTLRNPTNIPLGGSLTSVAVGDFLGDGLQDIVAANSDGTVRVLLSNGNGTFQAARTISIGATPDGVAVGDLNGDGKLDIVTANSNGTVTALLGNGDGTFGSPIVTTVGGRLNALAVGEFNGDGKPDLAVGSSAGLDVLLGKGDGTFQLESTIPFIEDPMLPFLTAQVRSVAVADFRGGGRQDIVAGTGGDVRVLLGNGDGTFQGPVKLGTGVSPAAAFAVGDFTGDGRPDIVTSNLPPFPPNFGGSSISLLAGNGDGTFQAPVTTNFSEGGSPLAAGDFNGDGKLDLAFAAGATVLLNTGGGTFATTPAYGTTIFLPRALASGDFTGHGKPDLVVTGIGGNVDVLLNNGNGTYHPGPTLTVGGSPDAVVVGDFNGDGKQDIVVGTEAGQVLVFLGNGDGTFQAPRAFTLGTSNSLQALVAGDFNGDHKLDLAVASILLSGGTETGQVTVLLGNGNGTFHKGQAFNVGLDTQGLAAGYFHGPGKLDLVTTAFQPDGSRAVKVLLGNGNGTFQNPVTVAAGGRPTSVGVGDFNGNGKQDLVLVDPYNHVVSVLPGNGNGTFQAPIPFQFTGTLTGLLGGPAVGDFFKTGKLSVAVTSGTGTVSVLQGNGDGTFQAAVSYVVGSHDTQPSNLIAVDVNGDGKLELVSTNATTGDVSVLLNTTTPPVTAAPVATATALAADVSPAVFGQPVDLTATVTSAAGTPTGTVTFFDGSTVLDEVALDPNGQAVFTAKFGVGPHALRAVLAGTGGFSGSKAALSETVNKAATTTTLQAGQVVFLHGLVILTATVTPVAPGAGAPTGVVTFFEGTTVLGTGIVDKNGQATLSLYAGLPKGKHTLTASYGGDGNFLGSDSDILTITI